MITKTLAITLTAAVLANPLIARRASADEAHESRSSFTRVRMLTLQVPVFDLDPTTDLGAKALYRRILAAAERVCNGPIEKRNGLGATRDAEQHAAQCFSRAVDAAVAEVRAVANVDLVQVAAAHRHAEARVSTIR